VKANECAKIQEIIESKEDNKHRQMGVSLSQYDSTSDRKVDPVERGHYMLMSEFESFDNFLQFAIS
jgi:hypothetical protein